MSRHQLTDEQAQALDEANARVRQQQAECGHYTCHPTEWHWSGQIRVMVCDDCGLEDYREESTPGGDV